MPPGPLFTGLVYDENDQLVETAFVGQEPCYVVDDEGFKRHIPSKPVDLQILNQMYESIRGHEEYIGEQAVSMLGQDDIFSRALFIEQLKNIDKQFDLLIESGLPEEGKAYMGMTGFRVTINHHGDVIKVEQPGITADDE